MTTHDQPIPVRDPRHWTPSPLHGDGWWFCRDTGAWENHWVSPPKQQRDAWERDRFTW